VTGFLVFLHFFGASDTSALYLAAFISLLLAIAFTGWLMDRARCSLGNPHPGWRWYLASIAFLLIRLAIVPAMHYWSTERQVLRLRHLHLNTLGYSVGLWLTSVGLLLFLYLLVGSFCFPIPK